MSICGEHSLVSEGVAYTLRCWRWTCEFCLPILKAELERKASAGDATIFLTLTCDPSRHECPDEAARRIKLAWTQVRRILQRQFRMHLPFLAVFEQTANGWPHLHLLIRADGVIPQRWLSAQMARLIGAPTVFIRSARKGDASYIAKGPQKFAGCKRHWASRDWIIAPSLERGGLSWERVAASLDQIERHLRTSSFAVIRRPNRLEWSDE